MIFFDGSLSVPLIYSYCKKQLCISTAKTFDYHEKSILENGEKVGEMVTIGVRGTQQWCIYNKLLEQNWIKIYQKCPHHGQEQSLDVGKKGKLTGSTDKKKDVPLKRFTLSD